MFLHRLSCVLCFVFCASCILCCVFVSIEAFWSAGKSETRFEAVCMSCVSCVLYFVHCLSCILCFVFCTLSIVYLVFCVACLCSGQLANLKLDLHLEAVWGRR